MKNKYNKFIKKAHSVTRVVATICVLQITIGFQATSAQAIQTFNHHMIPACKPYLDEGSSLPLSCRGNQTDNLCHSLEAIDDANVAAFTGAVLYSGAAIACGVACGTKIPWFALSCSALMVAAGIADVVYVTQASDDKYSEMAKDGRDTLFTATAVGTGTVSIIGGAITGIALVKASGSVANITKGTLTSRTLSCVGAGVALTFATMKYVNVGFYESSALKEKAKIPALATTENAVCIQSPNTPNADRGPTQSTVSAITSSNSGGGGSDPKTTYNTAKGDKLPDLSPKSLASAALADKTSGMGPELAEKVSEIAEGLEKNFGVTPTDIGNALASGSSPADIMSKLSPDLATLAGDLDKHSKEIADNLKLKTDADVYASAAAGGGSKGGAAGPAMPDLSALFGKKDGGAPVAGGVSGVTFGKAEPLSGDIWHIGTKKSLFEIVSDKWTNVVKRFIREDSEQNFMAQQGSPNARIQVAPGAAAPAASLRAPASVPR